MSWLMNQDAKEGKRHDCGATLLARFLVSALREARGSSRNRNRARYVSIIIQYFSIVMIALCSASYQLPNYGCTNSLLLSR